jgi:hypothetical protein
MRTVRITTRTLEPTLTRDKRIRVRSADGTVADYPWDHRYDAPEAHQEAARKVAVMENPNQEITMQRTGSDAMGYTFRAIIGRAEAVDRIRQGNAETLGRLKDQ